MAESEKPRPYPTPTRLRLMRDTGDGKVIEYTTDTPPWTYSKTEDRKVTDRIDELETAGLVTRDTQLHTYYKIVALTPAGEEWLNRYGSSE